MPWQSPVLCDASKQGGAYLHDRESSKLEYRFVFFLVMYNLMDGSIPVSSLLLLVRLLSIDLLRLLSMDRQQRDDEQPLRPLYCYRRSLVTRL